MKLVPENINEAIKHLTGRDPDEIIPPELKELDAKIKKEFNIETSIKSVKSATNIYLFFMIALRLFYITYEYKKYRIKISNTVSTFSTPDQVINFIKEFTRKK